jgi:hypothetical protein
LTERKNPPSPLTENAAIVIKRKRSDSVILDPDSAARSRAPQNALNEADGADQSDGDRADLGAIGESELELNARIVARPDGYYWIGHDGKQEFGPFASIESARADLQAFDENALGPGETLQEAEDEIGISDWIDPETGEPAEGPSLPHVDEE